MPTPTWQELMASINKLEYNLNKTHPKGLPYLDPSEKNDLITSIYQTIKLFDPKNQNIIKQKIRLAKLILKDITQTRPGSSDPKIEKKKSQYINKLLRGSKLDDHIAERILREAEFSAMHHRIAWELRSRKSFSPAYSTVTSDRTSGHQPPIQAAQLPPPIPPSQPILGMTTRRNHMSHDESPQVLAGGSAAQALLPLTQVHSLSDNPATGKPSSSKPEQLSKVKKRVRFELDKNTTYRVPSRRELNHCEQGSGAFQQWEGRENMETVFFDPKIDVGTIQYGEPEIQGAKSIRKHKTPVRINQEIILQSKQNKKDEINAKYLAAAERILSLVTDTGQIPTKLGPFTTFELIKIFRQKEPVLEDHLLNTATIVKALKDDYPTLEKLSEIIEFKHGTPIKPRR